MKRLADARTYVKPLYDDENRHYHNWSHIERMINVWDDNKNLFFPFIKNYIEIMEAIYFHDCVYFTGDKDSINVARSMDAYHHFCKVFDYKPSILVCTLINSTDYSNELPIDALIRMLTDLDLAILGSNNSDYCEYVKNIRIEYWHVTENDFIKKRIKILQKLWKLAKDKKLFYHLQDLNIQAEYNIKQEILSYEHYD